MVDRWNGLAKTFHWVLAILVLAQLYYGFTLADLPRDPAVRGPVFTIHVDIAVSILILMTLRLVWRLLRPAPKPLAPGIAGFAGRAVHWLFYLMLFGLSLGTIIAQQALGRTPAFFGMALPKLVEPNQELGRAIFSQHGTAGTILAVLVGLHVLAALWHHFIRKDNTLLRMLPGTRLRA